MPDASPTGVMPHATRPYSPAERLADIAVHLVGLGLALGAVPVLITLASVWRDDWAAITGIAVYGTTLIAMLLASLAYNHLPRDDWRETLRRIDQSAIYLKIAGSYTPFALLSGAGLPLFAVLWAVALAATVTAFATRRGTVVGVIIGLAMGWAVLVGGWGLIAELSTPVLVLIVSGGALFSIGTVFHMRTAMPFHNVVWHLLVVAGSTVFFIAIMMHLVQTAP